MLAWRDRIGPALVALYLIQYFAQVRFEFLEGLGQIPVYRTVSGLTLVSLVVLQWWFAIYRIVYQPGDAALRGTREVHVLAGSVGPLLLLLHSPRPDYGILVVLAFLFLGNSLLGMALEPKTGRSRAASLRFGIPLHVLLSALSLALIAWHIWVVFTFN